MKQDQAQANIVGVAISLLVTLIIAIFIVYNIGASVNSTSIDDEIQANYGVVSTTDTNTTAYNHLRNPIINLTYRPIGGAGGITNVSVYNHTKTSWDAVESANYSWVTGNNSVWINTSQVAADTGVAQVIYNRERNIQGAENSTEAILDQSGTFFGIAPIIAVVMIAVVILGYVSRIGGG